MISSCLLWTCDVMCLTQHLEVSIAGKRLCLQNNQRDCSWSNREAAAKYFEPNVFALCYHGWNRANTSHYKWMSCGANTTSLPGWKIEDWSEERELASVLAAKVTGAPLADQAWTTVRNAIPKGTQQQQIYISEFRPTLWSALQAPLTNLDEMSLLAR